MSIIKISIVSRAHNSYIDLKFPCGFVSVNNLQSYEMSQIGLVIAMIDYLNTCLEDGLVDSSKSDSVNSAISSIGEIFNIHSDLVRLQNHNRDPYRLLSWYQNSQTKHSHLVSYPLHLNSSLDADFYRKAGNVQMSQKSYPNAIAQYTLAITLDPYSPLIYCNRAAAFAILHDHKSAIQDAKYALSLDRDFPEAWSRLAYSQFSQNTFGAAIYSYTQALKIYTKRLKKLQQPITIDSNDINLKGDEFNKIVSKTFLSCSQVKKALSIAKKLLKDSQFTPSLARIHEEGQVSQIINTITPNNVSVGGVDIPSVSGPSFANSNHTTNWVQHLRARADLSDRVLTNSQMENDDENTTSENNNDLVIFSEYTSHNPDSNVSIHSRNDSNSFDRRSHHSISINGQVFMLNEHLLDSSSHSSNIHQQSHSQSQSQSHQSSNYNHLFSYRVDAPQFLRNIQPCSSPTIQVQTHPGGVETDTETSHQLSSDVGDSLQAALSQILIGNYVR